MYLFVDNSPEAIEADEQWRLRYSDGLDETEQQIFLDAITFFNHNYKWTLRDAKAAWRVAYDCDPEKAWRTLVDKSLVRDAQEHESIKVHERVHTSPKRIALDSRNEGTLTRLVDGGGFGSRGSTALETTDGIHALRIEIGNRVIFKVHMPRTTLVRMKNLRFLQLDTSVVWDEPRDVDLLPDKLVLLSCHAFDAAEFDEALLQPSLQAHLAVLKLFWKDRPSLPDCLWRLLELNTFILTAAYQVTSIPEELGQLSRLEFLRIGHCPELRTLPASLGDLKALKHLQIGTCEKLETLPDSIGQLQALTHLELDGCKQLESLPDSIGQLKSLTHVKLVKCDSLSSLPESFGELSALKDLQFESVKEEDGFEFFFPPPRACFPSPSFKRDGCMIGVKRGYPSQSLYTLPESFQQLSSLTHLILHNSKLRILPESFAKLPNLSYLDIECCESLELLPTDFGKLSKLTHLKVYGCKQLERLPDTFGELSALRHLLLDGSEKLQTLPESFDRLRSLSHLHLNRMSRLVTLPKSFGHLPSLTHLKVSSCGSLEALPETFGHLPSLNHLDLSCLENLRTLPDSFVELSTLQHLEIRSCKVKHLPEGFSRLSYISNLQISERSANNPTLEDLLGI